MCSKKMGRIKRPSLDLMSRLKLTDDEWSLRGIVPFEPFLPGVQVLDLAAGESGLGEHLHRFGPGQIGFGAEIILLHELQHSGLFSR